MIDGYVSRSSCAVVLLCFAWLGQQKPRKENLPVHRTFIESFIERERKEAMSPSEHLVLTAASI